MTSYLSSAEMRTFFAEISNYVSYLDDNLASDSLTSVFRGMVSIFILDAELLDASFLRRLFLPHTVISLVALSSIDVTGKYNTAVEISSPRLLGHT